MDYLTRQRIAVQSAEDHHHRAVQAEREGVRILVDARTGQHVATSASNPAGCYHVTPNGCTCRGWTFRGRCKHHSVLLAELGRIPDGDGPSLVAGFSDTDVIALKADAARLHYLHGAALVNIHTGELIA